MGISGARITSVTIAAIFLSLTLTNASISRADGWKLRFSNEHCEITKSEKDIQISLFVLLGNNSFADEYQIAFRRKTSWLRNTTGRNDWWNISDWHGNAGKGAEWDNDRFTNATLVAAIVDGQSTNATLQRDKRGDYEYLKFFDTYETNSRYNRLGMEATAKFKSIKIETIHTKKRLELVPTFSLKGIEYAYNSLMMCVNKRGQDG